MSQNVFTLLDYSSVSSEEFVAVHNDNVCTAFIMPDKDILEFSQGSKNIIDGDSVDEKKNKAATVPTTIEIRNIVKIYSVI
ncbi:hypothetical protein TNCV_117631 [Trichonephila clavipes]|nr:hypothetical protein TNCV_117631 [Trichonephila clavipes]